jgi:hypothetical protein
MNEAERDTILEEAMAKKHIAKYKDLAARVGCSERSLRDWRNGNHVPGPYYIGKLSTVLGIDAHELFHPTGDEDMDKLSRRDFLTGAVSLPIALSIGVGGVNVAGDPSIASTIATLDSMTAHYRTLQRNSVQGVTSGVLNHLATIQHTLENTTNERSRVELWRVLSKTQILARHNITMKQEPGKAKTFNELAIASAQNSGDHILLAATIGHLAHFHFAWLEDISVSQQLIPQAERYAEKNHAITGWLKIMAAATAAKGGDRKRCVESIDLALLSAHRMPRTDEYNDAGFTDFSIIGVEAFAANCLLEIGEPKRAYTILTDMNYNKLAINRHAYAYFDTTRALVGMGELAAAETFAIKAIEQTPTINSTHILPRFITLSREIQQREPNNPHALAIYDCALATMQQGGF